MPRGSLEYRFWLKVDKEGQDGCWLWTGCKTKGRHGGYGQIGVSGKLLRAHRVSWELANGPLPPGVFLDHVCNNRSCVNPGHLRQASLADNNCNRKMHRNNSCGLKGVYFDKPAKRWRARIRRHGVSYHLGRFDSPELAHEAYCKAAASLHGRFANFGSPNP